MGLHVGGIYVEASDNKVTQADVLRAIENYWTKIGAKKSALDPLDFEPLSLEETGRLGFVVSKPIDSRIAVYDSERYHADPALARELASVLGVDVWFYEFTDSVDHAYAKRYGKEEKVLKDAGDIEETIGQFPYALLYYNKLKETPEVLEDFATLAFEGIPYRPNAKYTGPSEETKKSIARAEDAEKLGEQRDAEALIALAGEHRVMWEVIKPLVEKVDLRDPKECAFVHALADVVLANDGSNRYVAEACLRVGDRERFERGLSDLADYQAGLASSRASQLIHDGEHDVAFAMLEQIARSKSARYDVFNNALYAFLFAKKHDLPEGRLDALFARAFDVGRANPPIFHNLACALVKVGRFDEAIHAVEQATKWGYELLEKMRADDDLAPLRKDPRFEKAFDPPRTVDLAEIVVRSATRKGEIVTIAPVVLFSLFFGNRKEAIGPIADLLARIALELPAGVFQHYMWGDGKCSWSKMPKGKIARDITALRKDEDYTACVRWGSHDGEPLGWRVSLRHEHEKGELSVMMPLDEANDPDALAAKLAGWASTVPFVCGTGGYALGIYEEGPVAGPGSTALGQIDEMRKRYLGLATQKQGGPRWRPNQACTPGWLTFLNPALADADFAPAAVTDLGNGVCVRAAKAPFVGLATAPNDLGALPAVAKALVNKCVEVERVAAIAAVPVSDVAIDAVRIAAAVEKPTKQRKKRSKK